MRKLFAVDLKRLLKNKSTILIAVLAPLLLALLISFAVAPYFFADVRADNFYVAVLNDDDHPMTVAILQSLIESESLGGLIEVRFVESEQEGMRAVRDGAAAYIHVPGGMQETLRSGGSSVISYYGNPEMPLEDALLFETLDSGTLLVSHAQHAVNVLYDELRDGGVDKQTASDAYTQTTAVYFSEVLSREDLYQQTDETSPLGGALPIEYYASSLLVLFVALGAMPIARITADDAKTGLVHRQLLSGHSPVSCFISRWLAGSAFLMVQYIVLAVCLILLTGTVSAFAGNVLWLFVGGILLCALVSLGMMLIGLYARTSAFATSMAFMGALALGLLGGLLVPSAYMPAVIRDVSYYTPFSAALRLGISGMFDGEASGIWTFCTILVGYIVVLLPFSINRFIRRTH